MAVWYPELFSLGALGAQKFTFEGLELLMAVISFFIDMVGNTPISQSHCKMESFWR